MNTSHESTYALLVRSEEKGRSIFETLAYVLFILCVIFTAWQFALHPVVIPAQGLQPTCVACATAMADRHAGS